MFLLLCVGPILDLVFSFGAPAASFFHFASGDLPGPSSSRDLNWGLPLSLSSLICLLAVSVWGRVHELLGVFSVLDSGPFFFFFLHVFIFERDSETEHEQGGAERGIRRHRIRSRLQALSCQHRARPTRGSNPRTVRS